MKTRTLISIPVFLCVLSIISSCATSPKKLIQLAESGDYNDVQRLINEGADVNA